MGTHELCHHPGCKFSASKRVVMAHYHGSHGEFSGTGFKTIEVEGQQFRVLMGSCPEEIEQWRKERRSKYPTKDQVAKKSSLREQLQEAGGIVEEGRSNRKRGRAKPETALPSKQPKALKTTDNVEPGESSEGREATHDSAESQSEKRANFPCKYNYNGKVCTKGEECPYSHTLPPLLCKRFLQTGRCAKGMKCMFVHDKKLLKSRQEGKTVGANSPGFAVKEERKKKDGLYLPDPTKGNLLRKLVQKEMNAEESLILQCLQFLKSKDYLQELSLLGPDIE